MEGTVSPETRPPAPARLQLYPLTPERWGDFERLFGPRGAYGGCWCMWWRLTRREFEAGQGEGNRLAMKALVEAGEVPGILAYQGETPVGWCSVAPRQAFGALNRSRVLRPVDDRPVWSIVCFYVPKEARGQGLLPALVEGAVAYVQAQGGEVVEAYPTVPKKDRLPPVSVYRGLPEVYRQAGFVEVARPSESKVVMRRYLGGGL